MTRYFDWIQRWHDSKRSIGKNASPTVEHEDQLPDDAKLGSSVYVEDRREMMFYAPVIPDSVVEDFERDDALDDWDDPENQAGNFSITTTDPLEGDRSLVGEGTQELIQTSNPFGDLPEQGDDFACLIRVNNSNGIGGFYFAAIDSDDNFGAQIRLDQDVFRIFKNVNGSFTELASTGISGVSAGDALDIRVEWGVDDSIEATLYHWDENNFQRDGQIASVSDTDGSFTDGGIGVRAIDGEVVFDWIRYAGADQ